MVILVSIILPVYNQADHLGRIVSEYAEALKKVPAEIEMLLVLNNCRDNSLEVAEKLKEQYPMLRIVQLDRGGWGLAVKEGVKHATGDLICYTNSARTSAEILTLTLLYAVAYPNVVIKANRKIREALTRRLGSLLYNLECRALFDLPTWDINGTPKIFPRNFDALMNLQKEDDLIDAEFNALCRRHNYPMLEVPILSTKRHGGKSTTNFKSAFNMYLGAYKLWQEMRTSN